MVQFKVSAWARRAGTGLALAAVMGLAVSSVRPAAQVAGSGAVLPVVPSVRILKGELISPSAAAQFYGTNAVATDGLCRDFPTNDQVCHSVSIPEIVELARALRHDPDLIYEYVRNRVDTDFQYGLQRGALGAIIDGSGTAFDQAQLMVELLRQSGYTASYLRGNITLSGAQFASWTGVANAAAACQLLASGGIPASINGSSLASCNYSGSVSSVVMDHVWVQATIDGGNYQFNPSFKPYEHKSGIDVRSAMAAGSGQISAAALGGMNQGTQDGVHYVSSLKGEALGAVLTNWSEALLQRMKEADLDGADLADVIGGRVISPAVRPEGGWRAAVLSYPAEVVSTWVGDVPDQYRTTLRVDADDAFTSGGGALDVFDYVFFVDEIYGRVLELSSTRIENPLPDQFVEFYEPYRYQISLALDGVGLAKGQEKPNPAQLDMNLNLVVDHPYAGQAGGFADAAIAKRVSTVLPTIIVHGWGSASSDLATKWAKEMGPDQAAALPRTVVEEDGCQARRGCVRQVSSGRALRASIAANWLAQFTRAGLIHAELADARITHHHSVGVVTPMMDVRIDPHSEWPDQQTNGLTYAFHDERTVVDLETSFGLTSRTADAPARRAASHAIAATAATLEGSVLEQLLDGVDSASSVRRLAWGNAPEAAETPSSTSRRAFTFTSANAAAASAIVRFENRTSGAWGAFNGQESMSSSQLANRTSELTQTIRSYADAGFAVTTSEESLLGPGFRHGSVYVSGMTSLFGALYERSPSRQAGGAIIANRYDAHGDPTDIAHVMINGGRNKGGGGTTTDFADPAPTADAIKDKFSDRSAALGVNLSTGSAGYQSPTLASMGQGEFPYRLEFRAELRGNGLSASGYSHLPKITNESGLVSNMDGSASLGSSAQEAMGASRAEAAAETIAAFVAMQDIWRTSPSTEREIAGALAADWWGRRLVGNVVSVLQGASSEQFVKLANGSWVSTTGGGARVTLVGGRQPQRRVSGPCRMTGCSTGWETSRDWDYSSLQVRRIGEGGDERRFAYWTSAGAGGTLYRGDYRHGFRLTEWSFPQGVVLSFSYEKGYGDVLTGVESNLGVSLPIQALGSQGCTSAGVTRSAMDAGGRIHKVRFEGRVSRTLTQRSDGNCRLSEVYSPGNADDPILRYTYNGVGQVKEARDAIAVMTGDRGAHQFFIAEGYRGERVDPLGGRYAVETLSDGRFQRHIDEMGRVSTATYDGRKRLLSRTSSWGDVTTFKYDERDNVIEKMQTPKAGCGTDAWWCQTITVKAEYHPTWNKPTKIILPATIGGLAQGEWTFTYNAQGLVQEVRSPTVFDARNNQNAQAVTRTWYDGFGRVTRTQDPTGIETSQVWGGGGLPAFCLRQSIASSQSGGLNLTTTYVCNAAGDVTSTTDPRGNATTTTYDALRRKTAEVGPAGTGIQTQWVYDLDGNVVEEKKWDAPANVWRTTATTYSLTGKPLTVTDPSGDVSRTCYDALDRAVVAVDPTGRATRTSYNAASQPTLVERWFTANVSDAACALTNSRPAGITTNTWRQYEYNAAGLQSAEIDANGNRTQMTYDGLGRLIVTTFADGAEAWSVTDQRGQAVLTKTRGGDYRDAYFDQMGRINHVWEHGASDPYLKGRNTRTGYDLAGRPVWKDVSTQPTATWNEALRRDVHIYGYDSAGRATTDQVQPMDAAIGSVAKTLTYGYDAAGNRTSIKWPDGFEATYAFDAANRPQTVSFGGHTATITHDGLGRRTGVNRSSGANTVYAYEPDSDLLSLTHNWAASAAQTAGGWSYVHDAAGRLTETEVTRLDLEWLPTTAYARAYGPANNLNQVASQAGQALTFNANGNLSTFQGATYGWTYGNRLENVSRPGMSAAYAYDGEDRRTMKTVDGVITRTLWSGADEVAEMDGAGNILRRFIPDGSGAMDGRLASLEANGTIYWHHTDHQGSVVATSNAAGAPVSLVNYSPNGELGTAIDGTPLTGPPTGSPFGYTGRQYDPETGLWHYRARYYHPQLGQFLSHDPIGTKDDPNLYLYVANDPVNHIDPTGEACVVANGWSDYCRRAALYSRLDARFAGQTRFFGAAAGTTTMLANLSMPGFGGAVVSGQTRGFMSNLSGSLEAMNMRMARGLESGSISGAGLDQRFIRAEQNMVQGHLNSLMESNPAAYRSMISEVNGLLNPRGAMTGAANFYATDRVYQGVLAGVREQLGRDIDFSIQSDREAIGAALVGKLRSSGACDRTGSRIKSC